MKNIITIGYVFLMLFLGNNLEAQNDNQFLKLIAQPSEQAEINHTVIVNGENVKTAGEANIAGNSIDGYFILDFTNHSGHYHPSLPSLEIARDLFMQRLNILNDF